jgi:mRNA-degrading endonuclease toxin of MazEF toxin-antitoxin module
LVVVCTSARFAVRRRLSNCVPFQAGDFGFTVDCVAQCENLLSIDKAQIDLAAGVVGQLDEAALEEVIKAIGYVMKSDCKPL